MKQVVILYCMHRVSFEYGYLKNLSYEFTDDINEAHHFESADQILKYLQNNFEEVSETFTHFQPQLFICYNEPHYTTLATNLPVE